MHGLCTRPVDIHQLALPLHDPDLSAFALAGAAVEISPSLQPPPAHLLDHALEPGEECRCVARTSAIEINPRS
jgi:hypothetical protein